MQEEFSIDELNEICCGLNALKVTGTANMDVNPMISSYFAARLAVAQRQASRG